MDKRKLKHIADSIPRLSYLENLELLQYIALRTNLDVDFDCIYLNAIDTLPIAAIYGVLLEDDSLFILTKNKQLYLITLSTGDYNIIELNSSILTKFKQLFNY